MKVLYAEDNLMNQRIVLFSLKKANYEVTIANDGIEAIRAFNENKFDLILMDLMMPNMDGFAATIRIREIETINNLKKTPIIALTANSMNNEREQCFSIGMDGFLTKPFSLEQLKLTLIDLDLSSHL